MPIGVSLSCLLRQTPFLTYEAKLALPRWPLAGIFTGRIFPKLFGDSLMNRRFSHGMICVAIFALAGFFTLSCTTAEPAATAAPAVVETREASLIDIKPNSPADTVRVFYTKLREKRFREAIHLTNLRPAIEGLTDDELREFAVDFEAIARLVPPSIEINGEIITGDKASVTARLPGEDLEELDIQEIRLRKVGDYWVILSVDEQAEEKIRAEGKNYFFNLKIETHQEEAKLMIERISKAQMVHSIQNNGQYAEISKLIGLGLLPDDIRTSESTGYNYAVYLSPDRRSYHATATPAVYGKTGRVSYRLDLSEVSRPIVTGTDNNGKPLEK
jgi:hypothetical protein